MILIPISAFAELAASEPQDGANPLDRRARVVHSHDAVTVTVFEPVDCGVEACRKAAAQLLSEGRLAVQAEPPLLRPTPLGATLVCGRASYRNRC